ncbi:probable membrane-associated kinase regulator 3 [Cajanus cajan]|uniref:Membrane-associated kinase regulator 4 n=1 Tax=Cajanus cajan TaxID=3821 RepID=A0A151TUQ9_CAJCA|nr:probable membrane-associated kinase regulator 3 [Cajanus cajan]KYP70812.1 hypothetical protein KK1_010047 [Cajanus cajan]
MATTTKEVHVEGEYIAIEPRSSPNINIFSCSINREFEFQNKKESTTTSPADELFYKGKLLPLHLPPRLQMVEKLLQNTDSTFGYARSQSSLEDSRFRHTMLSANATSPSESRRVSTCESLPPDWSSEIEGLVSDKHASKKQQWSKNLKQTKQFWLGEKLKASKAYLKSLFTKSGCSSDASKVVAVKKPKCKECHDKYTKDDDDATKNQNQNQNKTKKKIKNESFGDKQHRRQRSCAVKSSDVFENGSVSFSRRSFSGVIQRHYASKASSLSTSSSGSSSLSSSFSLSSVGSYELHLFNKSISAELENSIESAIAYCKKSQQEGSSNSNKVCGNKGIIMGSERVVTEKNESLI